MTEKKKKIYNIIEMAYPDVQEWVKKVDIVMIPIGSCEQHGLHLPLGCDSIEAWLATTKAAEKADVPHTPLVWFGYSPQHFRAPGEGIGSITVRPKVYQDLLYDIARSLIHHGFNKVVFVTGHTSNIKIIDELLRKLRYDTGALVALYRADSEHTQFIPEVKALIESPPEETPGWHGGEIETSACLYYNSDLVHLERYKKGQAEFNHAPEWLTDKFTKKDGDPYVTFKNYKGYYLPMDHCEYSTTGLTGNPFRGSKEKGEKMFDIISTYLADFLEELKKIEVKVTNREFRERV